MVISIIAEWLKLFRSSRQEVFCKKGVLRELAKFTGKHLCQSLFFNKVTGLQSIENSIVWYKNRTKYFFVVKLFVIFLCSFHVFVYYEIFHLRSTNFRGYIFSRILRFLAIFAKINTREILLQLKFAKINTREKS